MTAASPTWPAEMVDDVIAAMRARRTAAMRAHPNDLGQITAYPYEVLADRYPPDDVIALMEALDLADITDYGVSPRTGWVRDYDPRIADRIEAFKNGVSEIDEDPL